MKDEDVALSTSASSLAIWQAHLVWLKGETDQKLQTHPWWKPLNHNTVTNLGRSPAHTSTHRRRTRHMIELEDATQSNSRNLVATFDGVEIAIEACPDYPDLRRIIVQTPYRTYRFGDYTDAEALEIATGIAQHRREWQPTRKYDYWEPTVWQSRQSFRGGIEFWRRGPGGPELVARQPHGPTSYWRAYWGSSPIVRYHSDLGIFDTPFEAIGVLEGLAENGMEGALLD
jgi:hypothetical protein